MKHILDKLSEEEIKKLQEWIDEGIKHNNRELNNQVRYLKEELEEIDEMQRKFKIHLYKVVKEHLNYLKVDLDLILFKVDLDLNGENT